MSSSSSRKRADAPSDKATLGERVRERVRAARARSRKLDHFVRAVDRHAEVVGGQEAAAVTYFGFLAFFPLVALGFSLLGYVSVIYPDVQEAVTEALREAAPNLIGPEPDQIDIQQLIGTRRTAGIFGIVGLLIAGLGWLNALRNALRRTFATADIEIAFLKRKVLDLGVLVLLGVSLVVSVMVTSMATAATRVVLDFLALEETLVATGVLKTLSVALALLADTVLFAIVLSRLSGAGCPWRQVRSGAIVAAAGFEILKLVGTFLIARTTANPVYATFGVVVGLLVWMNLVARLTIFAAAWTVTQPFSLHPGDLNREAAGRATPMAASTEPVSVVAPRDYEQVPVPVGWRDTPPAATRSRRRYFVVGALVGAGTAGVVSRWLLRRT